MKRGKNFASKPKIKEKLLKLYQSIDKGFLDAAPRINETFDHWDLYNCEAGQNQYYNGNANVYVPIVHDAIEARRTRYTAQVFPSSGRYVEVVTSDESLPQAIMALVDHYVDHAHLRDQVIPALFRNGDLEGQWNLYVEWTDLTRHTTKRVSKPVEVEGLPIEGLDEIEDVEDEETSVFGPAVTVLPDTDVLVMPAIANSIDEAFSMGGSVTILRRWSKATLEKMKKDSEMDSKSIDILIARLEGKDNTRKDMMKEHVDSAGIKGGGKYALGYETWTMLNPDGDGERLCKVLFGGEDLIIQAVVNEYWCDLCPLISAPVIKQAGSFKGVAPVKAVKDLQYLANDFMNQGADSATYGLLPIILTDPIKNPRVSSMVLDLGAVWETDPNSTRFAEFPELWKDALMLVGAIKEQIFQTLGVNPAMVPQRSSSKKPTQAEIASEQQMDFLQAADVAGPFEAAILTPLVQRFVWYDMQFRDEDITVKAFGREGVQANMEVIPPIQMNNRQWFRWYGVEQSRSQQTLQLQMAGMNVLKEIPPQLIPGRQIDMVPLIERFVENTFGPKLAPLVFKKIESMEPDEENQLLSQGFDLPVSPIDNDQEHMQKHAPLAQNDPHGVVKAHMYRHQLQMGQKNAATAAQQQGQDPSQGGGGPTAGAATQKGRNQGPPGMIHQDQMAQGMPRR